MKPFFSIVIPTLNEEDYLPRLLTDLESQTKKNFESIVVDASSVDSTRQKVKLFQRKLPLHLYNVKKKDVSYQRNIGAKKAKGTFLIFLDADARIESTFIARLTRHLNKNKYFIYIPDITPRPAMKRTVLLFKITNQFIKLSQKTKKPIAAGGSLIMYKPIFDILGGYKETSLHEQNILYPEDQDILVRAKQHGIACQYINTIQVGSSLRRMEKEGWLSVVSRYTISIVEWLTFGKITKKLQYKMGGQVYKDN